MPTPRDAGFSMPAEWAPHDRCWIAWPCRESLWGAGIDAACAAYANVARAIAEFEPVTMVCNPSDVAEASLACGAGVEMLSLPIDDSWMRDTGPTFVTDGRGQMAGIDWQFNGWGKKYEVYGQDAQLASRVAEQLGIQSFEAPIVLEGGAVHVDGEGTALVTEQCLLDPNRNPGVLRHEMDRHLQDLLGIDRVIWLETGYDGDETAGHIDEICVFAAPGVVLACTTDDENDRNFPIFQANLERLRAATDAKGRSLDIVELPTPRRRDRPDGQRLTLSYVNFYIANGGVVIPDFEDDQDVRVYRLFREIFPDRRVVQVPALDIVAGGGGIHCITQQQPSVD